MWVPSTVKDIFPNADRNAQASAIAAFAMQEEKNEESQIAPSSSPGAGNTAPVSRIADGGGGGGGGGTSHSGGVQQLAEENKIQIAVTNLAQDISNLEVETLGVERQIYETQEAVAMASVYRGRRGDALTREVERLALKEQQLRHKERQLRDEKLVILRRPSLVAWPEPARGASIATPKRVSFIETYAHPNDPEQEDIERRRLMTVKKVIRQRSISSLGYTAGDEAGNDTVITFHKVEEDPRLLAKLGSFHAPIVVSTLLAGFTLVLFDVSKGKLSQQLALLSFAFEVTASTVLSLIVYHGQNLYSYSTDIKPLTREFIRRTAPVIVLALVVFALGVVLYVAAFVIEASEHLGIPWMAVMLVMFFPTVIAAVLFAYSTVLIKSRYSFNQKVPAAIQPGE